MRKQLFPFDTQIVDGQGRPTITFYELLDNIMNNLPTKKVSATDPTAAQTLKYDAATDQYKPG